MKTRFENSTRYERPRSGKPALALLLASLAFSACRTTPAKEPPVAQQRLRLTGDGRVLVTLKEEWRDGTTHLLLERVELLERARPSRPPILPPSCRLRRSPAARRHPWWPGSD